MTLAEPQQLGLARRRVGMSVLEGPRAPAAAAAPTTCAPPSRDGRDGGRLCPCSCPALPPFPADGQHPSQLGAALSPQLGSRRPPSQVHLILIALGSPECPPRARRDAAALSWVCLEEATATT